MSVALLVLLTVVSLPPSARRDEIVVNEASEVVDYCRAEAEAISLDRAIPLTSGPHPTRAAATPYSSMAGCT